MKKTMLLSFVLAILLLSACTDRGGIDSDRDKGGEDLDIPFSYVIPSWYEKSMEFADIEDMQSENQFEVLARIRPILMDMNNAEVTFHASEGLEIAEGGEQWKGSITKDETREFRLTVSWKDDTEQRKPETVKMYFEYDFPEKELLDYVEENKASQYDDSDLRKSLIDEIKSNPEKEAGMHTLWTG